MESSGHIIIGDGEVAGQIHISRITIFLLFLGFLLTLVSDRVDEVEEVSTSALLGIRNVLGESIWGQVIGLWASIGIRFVNFLAFVGSFLRT